MQDFVLAVFVRKLEAKNARTRLGGLITAVKT